MAEAGDGSSVTGASLLALGATTFGDCGGFPLDARVGAIFPGAQIAGPAFTASCAPGDNLAVHSAIARAPVGSVLAVSAGAIPLGHLGEVLARAARAAGIIGAVVDGSVRDVAAFEEMCFPVFATGRALRGATKLGPGTVGGPIELAGVQVRSGDWLVGDVDGVVMVAADTLEECTGSAKRRLAREAEMFEAIGRGATTLELFGLDERAIRVESRGLTRE